MNTPQRIQRQRFKGWKMPENTIYVGRPTKWGNPFKLEGDQIMVDAAHRRTILSPWVFYKMGDKNDVVKLFRDLLMDLNSHPVEDAVYKKFRLMRDTIYDLRGKNLACWCKAGEYCHADALLELANC